MDLTHTLAGAAAASCGGGAQGGPEPGATTNGSGLLLLRRRRRARRRTRCRLVIVAADEEAAGRYLRWRPPIDTDVHVVTTPSGLFAVDDLRLGRRDRVEWVAGWRAGPRGRALALAAERAAVVGSFGAARHGFALQR